MSRPVILLGHGIRAAGAARLVPRLVEHGVPILASWQAKDLIDNDHPLFMGCPGIYGNRAANKALANATEILAIGNRLAIWHAGYEGLRNDQDLILVSLDDAEAIRHPRATWLRMDAKEFLESSSIPLPRDCDEWRAQCLLWRTAYTVPEYPAHDDIDGYINSYRFFDRLNEFLRPEEQIAIDCGAACASAFQALRVKPPQRIYSSGGLGEMGCALPAAIGVSFARNKGDVICIVGDGALMMNLQELQTIVHHNLPVKIIVAKNDGYLMLKHTQKNAGMAYSGVNAATGISCPDFRRLASSFGITAGEVRDWSDFDRIVRAMLHCEGPALIEYHMHPLQPCVPKLGYHMEGSNPVYDTFSNMSPALRPIGVANA